MEIAMSDFYVISLKHTHRRHKAITLWQPNDSGYCWRLENAGTYQEAQVLEHLSYYNSGCSNIAVPADLVRSLSREVEFDLKMNGVCLPNTAATWRKLLTAVIRPPDYPSYPEYRGAPHIKAA